MNNKPYLFVTCDIKDASLIPEYEKYAGPVFIKYGAKPLFKFIRKNHLYGRELPQIITLAEYPSFDNIEKQYYDPAYSKALEIRELAFSNLTVQSLEPLDPAKIVKI